MTLDGRVKTPHIESQLAEPYSLVKVILILPDNFPETQCPTVFSGSRSPYNFPPPSYVANGAGIPTPSPIVSGCSYYFDVSSGQDVPDIKWSLPLRNYDRDDMSVAGILTAWMEK